MKTLRFFGRNVDYAEAQSHDGAEVGEGMWLVVFGSAGRTARLDVRGMTQSLYGQGKNDVEAVADLEKHIGWVLAKLGGLKGRKR